MARTTRKSTRKSSGLTPAQFMRQVEQGGLGPVYVFVGEDNEAVGHAWAAVRNAYVPEELEEFCLEVLHAESDAVDAAQIIGAAETVPFMGATRVVLVRQADELRADDLGPLAEYIEQLSATPRDDLLLVLLFSALDKRTKFARTAYAAGCVVEFTAASVSEVVATMQERYGTQVEPAAVRLLEEYLQGDTRSAYAEVDKLFLYAGECERVTADDVVAVCVDSATRNEWAIADRLVQGNRGAAVEALRQMQKSGADTIYQYTIIATALTRLPGAADALARGSLYKEWKTYRIGYNDPGRREVERHLRSLTPEAQAQVLSWLMLMDICLKGTAVPGDIVCELTCMAAR